MTFDSDYMVFVSPPPMENSKAAAPFLPFNYWVTASINQLSVGNLFPIQSLLMCHDYPATLSVSQLEQGDALASLKF